MSKVGTLVPAQPGWVCWYYGFSPATGEHVRDFSIPLVGWRLDEYRVEGTFAKDTKWVPVIWTDWQNCLVTTDEVLGYGVLMAVCPDGTVISDAARVRAREAAAVRFEEVKPFYAEALKKHKAERGKS